MPYLYSDTRPRVNAPSVHAETARILAARVKQADTAESLREMEKQVTRHYDNGTISAAQLAKLDVSIMEKLAAL